jgi:uncharacterized protein Smg (DUF494 family)
MAKSNIIKALEQLDKKDIYSLILFILYNLKEVPEYSTLSELVYILDNENFIKLLNYYGGKTITIPTTDELSNVLNALVVYEKKENTDKNVSDILKEVGVQNKDINETIKILEMIPDILKNYEFNREIK